MPEIRLFQRAAKTQCVELAAVMRGRTEAGARAATGDAQSTGNVRPEVERVRKVYGGLTKHALRTATTTGIDARHDTALGIGLYALAVLHEIMAPVLGEGVLGRVGLRVLCECLISLGYLVRRDDADLWRSYRVYGAGQAKLAMLKFVDVKEPPATIDLSVLEQLANEDASEEFVAIDVGHWEKSNLRSVSEIADMKEEYDRYYMWPSHYAHGHWGAVRDTVFDTCVNSLHRFHRIPRGAPRALPEVTEDAVAITDKILDLVSAAYPTFAPRVGKPKPS